MKTTQANEILQLIITNNQKGTTNYDLSRISLKYSSRIAELRAKGHDIYAERVQRHGKASGTYLYFIREKMPEPVKQAPPENAKLFETPIPRRRISF